MNSTYTQAPIKTIMIPDQLIIIEPTNFQINSETINDNQYMSNLPNESKSKESIHSQVLQEHKNYQNKLSENKINFQVHKQIHKEAYDSIFACDWLATIRNEDFPDGILCIFPVRWPTRRLEKNYELVDQLKSSYKIFEDLSFFEQKDLALEAFGALSLDFHNRIIYFNLSERCHLECANYFLELLNKHSIKGKYKIRVIESVDPKDGIPVFHSGLYLAFNDNHVFFCKDFVKDSNDAERLVREFSELYLYKYEVILLSYEETIKMCANVVEVKLPGREKPGLLMSRFSAEAYSEKNLRFIKENYEIIVVEIDMINQCAGGSLRCMTSCLF